MENKEKITMNMIERSNSAQDTEQKAPYQKPEFRYESVFETSALSCGKIHTTQAGCAGMRKAS